MGKVERKNLEETGIGKYSGKEKSGDWGQSPEKVMGESKLDKG